MEVVRSESTDRGQQGGVVRSRSDPDLTTWCWTSGAGALGTPVAHRADTLVTLRAVLGAEHVGGQPQTLQPSDAAGGTVVGVATAGVEDVVVVDELHLTGAE